MEYKYVGKNFPIHDAASKVTGSTLYAGDLKLPNMLYAKILFSSVAHGIIKEINTEKALQDPDVVEIFTYLNTPEKTYNRYRIYPDQGICPEDQALFSKKVRYYGDWVAAVVAKSEEAAEKALALIEVEYEELPALLDPRAALEDNSEKIHDGGNVVNTYSFEFKDDTVDLNNCLETTSHVQTQRMHHAAMETHCCLAQWDTSGKITIWTPCQSVFGVRTVVAGFLGMSSNKVRVIKTPLGGSFGGKQEAILEPLTAFLALKTRSAVMLRYNRKETIVSSMIRPATEHKIYTACSSEGKILKMDIDTTVDAGAYTTNSYDYIAGNMGKVTKLYRLPNVKYQARSVFTNAPIAGGMRGWGASEFFAGVEIHMDQAAKQLGMDPVEFRIKNLIHPHDVDPVTKVSIGNGRIIECLEEGAKQFNFSQRYKMPRDTGRFRVGVGSACGVVKTGMYGGFPEMSNMILRMNEDGSFVLNTAVHEMGCGSLQSLRIILAEALDTELDMVEVLEADTERSPYDFGTYASRVTYLCGACAYKAAQTMRDKILDVASRLLQVPKEHLKIDKGKVYYYMDQNKFVSYKDIGLYSKSKCFIDLMVSESLVAQTNPGAYGAHFAEVEVDTYTGLVRVTDYLAVHDVGQAINRMMLEGQVQGAVQMGIGYALCEEVALDTKGKVISDNFKNYHVINAPDMPRVKTLFVERGEEHGPFGAKSIGEISTVPVAPAVVNAVNHALGTSLSDLPLTPKKIIAALREEA